MKAFYRTIEQLAQAEHIPSEYIPACHLIYSAPATLAYKLWKKLYHFIARRRLC